jgi:phosphoinositide-3-kinase regulatory subunit 4
MGQGYSLTTLSTGSAGIDIPELSDLMYEKSMGGGRFMKSIRARQQNGLVLVKVIMKPYPSMKLESYVKAIIREFAFAVQQPWIYSDNVLGERKLLSDVPNALSHQRILETGTGGYLVRQYIHSSLYDRMRYASYILSARNFLTPVALDHFQKKSRRNGLHFNFYVLFGIVTHWMFSMATSRQRTSW